MRDKITFEPNTPVEVALEFAKGKIMPGKYGDQVMYSLQGQRVMFLDLAVSQKVNMLAPAVGETFLICKRPKNGSVPVRWDLWLSPATEQLRALRESPGAALRSPAVPTSQLEQQLDASLRQIEERRAALPSRRPPTPAIVPPAPILGYRDEWASSRALARDGAEDDVRRRDSRVSDYGGTCDEMRGEYVGSGRWERAVRFAGCGSTCYNAFDSGV